MNKIVKGLAPVLLASMLLAGCNKGPKYTTASAIDASAAKLSEIMGDELEANHDEDGDWWAFGWKTQDPDDLEEFYDELKGAIIEEGIPEGFELYECEGWTEGHFTSVDLDMEYVTYAWKKKVSLEYAIYYQSGAVVLQCVAEEIKK